MKTTVIGKKYFPNEASVKMRTLYKWVWKINGKTVKSGTSKGAEMVKMVQFKRHNIETMHEFEFAEVQ